MKRTVEYDGWTIEASPTILVKQRLFKSGVGISRGNLYFFFHDLGNRVYRAQAYERGIEWAKQWIDNNCRYGSSHLTQEQAMSKYSDKLFALCDEADRLTGTGGGRALRKIIMDLESDGPIGELMFTLDDKTLQPGDRIAGRIQALRPARTIQRVARRSTRACLPERCRRCALTRASRSTSLSIRTPCSLR